jgi:methylmalonyl-CoA mutase cobalamin-binding subunit
VLTSVSSDSHTWNLVFLQLLLEELGCAVVNLGACVPDQPVLGGCRLHRPDMLVVSTVNGHGHVDGKRLIQTLRSDPELRDLNVVIGGKLGVHGRADVRVSAGLLEAGFDAVFQERSAPEDFRRYLMAGMARPAVTASEWSVAT